MHRNFGLTQMHRNFGLTRIFLFFTTDGQLFELHAERRGIAGAIGSQAENV